MPSMRLFSQAGTTLVELAVVVVIAGLLIGIAAPPLMGARENAQRATCHANQRQLELQAMLLVSDGRVAGGEISIGDLVADGLVRYETAHCPAGNGRDATDYWLFTHTDGNISIQCQVSAAHNSVNGPQPPKPGGGKLQRWLRDLLG